MLALVEEVGELATALFEQPRHAVHREAIQVAVVAIRVILDGDHTLDQWREDKGLDPLVDDEQPIIMTPMEQAVAKALHVAMIAAPNYDPEAPWLDERLLAKAAVAAISGWAIDTMPQGGKPTDPASVVTKAFVASIMEPKNG
jgi:AcrR family transcriptional regulator